jgi:hypothetical protein
MTNLTNAVTNSNGSVFVWKTVSWVFLGWVADAALFYLWFATSKNRI